jgi:Zn-dependent protease
LGGSITIATIAGIPIRLHFSWLLILGLLVWSLGSGFFPEAYPGWGSATYYVVAAVAAVGFFLAILVHELSHSLVARARNLPVSSITLFIFGGVSQIEQESRTPGTEFLVTVVGPLSSLLIGGVCYLLTPIGGAIGPQVEAILAYLATVNVLVGLFNLIPGFPLDGGRILRAIVWGLTGDLLRATAVATLVGRGVAFLMIFGGIWFAFNGAGFQGLWIAFVGWFLDNAAVATNQQTLLHALLGGARVRQAMRTEFTTVPPALPVAALVDEHFLSRQQRAFPVWGGDRLWGMVTLTDVARLPRDRWPTTSVEEIMTPRDRLVTTTADAPLEKALAELQDHGVNQIPVLEPGSERVVGLLSRSDVMNFLHVRQQLFGGRALPRGGV